MQRVAIVTLLAALATATAPEPEVAQESARWKRSDDVSTDSLQTLVQQQASAIQTLQASLAAQDNRLQASLAAEDNRLHTLETNFQAQQAALSHLQDRVTVTSKAGE